MWTVAPGCCAANFDAANVEAARPTDTPVSSRISYAFPRDTAAGDIARPLGALVASWVPSAIVRTCSARAAARFAAAALQGVQSLPAMTHRMPRGASTNAEPVTTNGPDRSRDRSHVASGSGDRYTQSTLWVGCAGGIRTTRFPAYEAGEDDRSSTALPATVADRCVTVVGALPPCRDL
jgi:hypothetical protein